MNSNQNQHQFKKQNPLFSAAVTGGIDDLGIVLATAGKSQNPVKLGQTFNWQKFKHQKVLKCH